MTARVRFEHLEHLTDDRGLFEHAEGTERRPEHGYCTDDNARLLVVATRASDLPEADRLSRIAIDFVLASQDSAGRNRNRMDADGRWLDAGTTEDCWGRALWGLGVAAAFHADPDVRARALDGFNRGAHQRSPWSRSMAFAAIGAAAVLTDEPDHELARLLLADAVDVIGRVIAPEPMRSVDPVGGTAEGGSWVWPEPCLRYANAVLAEALIAAGDALGHRSVTTQGLEMLGWLLRIETAPGHLSVTGTSGRCVFDRGPQFDQQPIEAAAVADACARAFAVTGDPTWSSGLRTAVGWFDGDNDAGLPMFDDRTGGGFDGLHRDRVNRNQGAESTLAYVSTMQQAAWLLGSSELRAMR